MPVTRSHGWPLEREASPGLQVEIGGKLTAAQLAGQGGPHLHVGAEGILLFQDYVFGVIDPNVGCELWRVFSEPTGGKGELNDPFSGVI